MPDGTTAPSVDATEKFVVRYRYGEGILLDGNTRPFKDKIKSAWPRWRWFRSLGQWGVQRTRDKALSRSDVEQYAKGLKSAGIPNVEVDYEAPQVSDLRDFAALKQERDERSLERADRLSDRAERLHDKAAAEFGASSAAVAGIPPGQPILVGHHSEKRHRRDLDRSHQAMRRGVEASERAKHAEWTERSTRARHARSQTPDFAIRRLKELTAERRKVEVVLTGEAPAGWRGEIPRGPATGDYRERLVLRRAELDSQISFYRTTLEKDHVPITPEMVKAGKVRIGDVLMTEFGLVRVVRLRKASILGQHRRGQDSAPFSRVWVPRSLLAERKGTASAPSPAARKKLAKAEHDKRLSAIASQHDITPEESWPQIFKVNAVLVDAERQGLGAQMFTWLRQNRIQRPDTVGTAYGYARGVVALETGSWPPPPTRGSYYGKDHFNGLLSSLKHHAVVAELMEVAQAWPKEMEAITKGRARYWFNDGRIAALAVRSIHDIRLSVHTEVVRGERPTIALARKARDSTVASATFQLSRLRTLLDPTLYNASSPVEDVYPRLCEIDPEAAGKVLSDVFGVEFPDDRDAAAYAVCRGDTTLEGVKEKADAEAEETRERRAKAEALRRADARDLLAIRAEAEQRGELTPRRFNHAYQRLHPKLSQAQRRRRAMAIGRRRGETQATVRGPRDSGFLGPFVAGSEGDAVAALLGVIDKAAGATSEPATKPVTETKPSSPPPTGKPSNRTAAALPSAVVDVEEIARRHGITKDKRWPHAEPLRAAMLEALRRGEGPRMFRWLRQHRIQQPKYLAEHYGYASGALALENKAWPPPPERGKTYSIDYFLGLIDSLRHEPAVMKLQEYVATWPDRMEKMTHGGFRLWFDGNDDRTARSLVENEYRLEASLLRDKKNKPNVARARNVRESMVHAATRLLSRMKTIADPALYDPSSNPREVYPVLCKVDSTAAGHVLKDVFDVPFPEKLQLRALQLCTGERTFEEVTQEAETEAKQAREKGAAAEAERQYDARTLLLIAEESKKRGGVTARRFNAIYRRKFPKLRRFPKRPPHQFDPRRLRTTGQGGKIRAFVRGPDNHGFSVSAAEGSRQDAIDRLMQLVETEALAKKPHDDGAREKKGSMDTLKAPRQAQDGSLWSVDEEGFALTSPRGEGQRVSIPTGHQPTLVEVGPPDGTVLERQRAEELAARRGSANRNAAPLLEKTRSAEVDSAPSSASDDEAEPRPPEASDGDDTLARLEYVDVATGSPAEPSELGTLSTGRVVATIEGETVEVDPEDLVGRGSDPDPRKRRYRFDADSPANYEAQAQAKKADRQKRPAKKTRGTGRTGPRKTFDSASKAAAVFYDNNAAFLDHVSDPWDGLRDWMDGIEVRVGKGHRKLAQTTAGQRILGNRHAARAIRGALAYLFGQAKGRRWEAVPWDQIDRLGESLEPYFQAPAEGGQPGLTWRPFTGTARVEDLDAMSPEQRQSVREQEAAKEIGEQLDQLRTAYERAKDCLPSKVRRVVERRISEWSRWVKDPAKIPEYACEPDPDTMGYLCNYPAVAGELAQLRRSCDDAYDPAWAAHESKRGTPGFPDTSAGEDDVAPAEAIPTAECCGTSKTTAAPPTVVASKPKKARAKKPPKAAKPQSTKPARKKAKKSSPRITPADKRRERAERRKSATKQRERKAAERAARRLRCSATAAETQAQTIDLDSYRKRVTAAEKAVKEAEGNVAKLDKAMAAARQEAAALRGKTATPKDRRTARKKVEDARCALRIAKGKLTQRKRDHRRATTELRTATARAEKRQAVATKKKRRAERAATKARALAKDGT